VGRQASYLAHEILLGPEKSDLGCSPALYAGVQEDIDFVLNDFVIAVESCEQCCANKLVAQRGGRVHATIRVDDVLADGDIAPAQLPLHHLALDHPAVRLVAEKIVQTARHLLNGHQEG